MAKLTSDEEEIYDVVFRFSQGESINSIATDPKRSRQRVASLLQKAFTDGFVHLPLMAPGKLTERLQSLYPNVEFCVINASYNFFPIAALQTLTWIRSVCETWEQIDGEWHDRNQINDRRTYVAVGGGTTMRNVATACADVLRNEGTKDLSEWLDGSRSDRLCFLNATAGGLPREPAFESSYVACLFAQACRQHAAVYSLSGNPSTEEAELVECAVKNTSLLISGVGEPERAYCIRAMTERGILKHEMRRDLVGEFVFHPFDVDGQSLLGSEEEQRAVEVKENTMNLPGKSSDAMLSTLLRFDSLRGRPAHNLHWKEENIPRYVAAIANCTSDNIVRKATAVNVLLENGYLTHLCVSWELAEEIIRQSRSPR